MNKGFDDIQRRLARLAAARLYLVLDAQPHGLPPGPLLDAALANGVDVVQLREKRLSDATIVASAAAFRDACDRHGALFIVNDRPELAVRCGADGVHVGQDDMTIADARAIIGPELIVGQSTHSPQDIDAAADADYIGVGPVWSTPTKPGRASVGLQLVEYAAASDCPPFFAIGGIDIGNIDQVIAAGARRVAVLRAIRDADDPAAATRKLVAALDASPAAGT
jgi:thiamine-phosphate pyrophosphorylase